MEHVREQEIKSYINSIVTSDYDLYELLNLNEEEKELLFIFISRLKGSRDTDAYFENINSVTLNKLGQIIVKIYIEVVKIKQLGININIILLNLIREQYQLIVDSKVAQQEDPSAYDPSLYYPLDHLLSESDSDTLENDFDSPVPAPISATSTPNSKTPMGPQGTPYIQSPGAAASAAAVPLSSARELFPEEKNTGGKKRKRRRTKKRKSKKKRKRKSKRRKRKSRKRRKRTRRS